jgi:uncharacterized damage-inducible protein DinB
MPLYMSVEELLRYGSEERDKWRRWFLAHPDALEIPVQPGGRHASAGKLVDHIFLAERRQLQRLMLQPVSEATGLTAKNAPPLFDYGASVRRELEQYIRALDDEAADEPMTFEIGARQWTMTPRKVLLHILFHEIRHWAQIALAVRLAGLEPPGDHDLLFSKALK